MLYVIINSGPPLSESLCTVNIGNLRGTSNPLQLSFDNAAPLVLFCRTVQEQFQTLKNEIEGLKKASADEMLQNESLTITLKKTQSEEANLKRLIAVGQEKKESLETQLSTVHKVLEQTDKELLDVMSVSICTVKCNNLLFSNLFPFILQAEPTLLLGCVCFPLQYHSVQKGNTLKKEYHSN
jgi:hypothetical protein